MPASLLTAKFCSAVSEPGKHRDGEGLELRASPTLSKSWVLRVRFRSRRPEVGLALGADDDPTPPWEWRRR